MEPIALDTRPVGKSMTLFGIVSITLGVLAMLAPAFTGMSIAVLLGGIVLVAGILRMFWAFKAGSVGRGLLALALGLLTVVCGISLLANPLFAVGFLTVLLTVYFILDGASEIAAGYQNRPRPGWWVFVLGGAVSILLGGMIWAQFPFSGAWAMGVMIGVKLFFIGLLMLAGGRGVKSLAG